MQDKTYHRSCINLKKNNGCIDNEICRRLIARQIGRSVGRGNLLKNRLVGELVSGKIIIRVQLLNPCKPLQQELDITSCFNH